MYLSDMWTCSLAREEIFIDVKYGSMVIFSIRYHISGRANLFMGDISTNGSMPKYFIIIEK